jgi:hypothetical protein
MENPSTSPDTTPWYLKRAERPKKRRTFNIFEEHVTKYTDGEFKDHSSGFVRYLMDCYALTKIPTKIGFKAWTKNGEKFSEISK